jgi:hypothetical protein
MRVSSEMHMCMCSDEVLILITWVFLKLNLFSWSECAVDDTDDAVTGDNRDGDEQWYQYRTQEFCANAAYSLYGAKKGELALFGCTRGHFINSFFTYGGADNLLKAAGKNPVVYYDDYNYGGDNNNNNGNYSYNTNAMCQAINYDDDQANGQQDQDEQQSGDQENSLVSTMGCSSTGEYVIASFQAENCDGNYFLKEVDSFQKYNQQHSSVGCHRVWGQYHPSNYAVSLLLNNSWSCDLDLYPNGCPDPYGKKERWDYALRIISRGGNAKLAYRNMLYKTPLRILSVIFAVLAMATLGFGYYIKNRERIGSKGGKLRGYFRCMWEDICEVAVITRKATVRTIRAQLKKKRRKRKKKKSRGSKEYDTAAPSGPNVLMEDSSSPTSHRSGMVV